MDIHQLTLFLAVMDSPSMTRAAEKVFLSPRRGEPQLHKLADELHTELFVRNGNKLLPTSRGAAPGGAREGDGEADQSDQAGV